MLLNFLLDHYRHHRNSLDFDHNTVTTTDLKTFISKDWNSCQHPMDGTCNYNLELEIPGPIRK